MKKYFFSLVYPACSLLIYFGVLRFFSPDHRESFYLISISMGIMVIGEGLRATIISRSNDPENFFSSTFMFSSFLSYVIFCLCLLYYSVSVVGLVHAFAISFLTSLYGLRVFLRVWFDINKEFFVLFAMGSVRVAFASMVFLGFLNDINGYVIGLIISRSLEISVLCFFSYKKISRFRVFFDKKNCLFLIKSISERLVFSFRDLLFGYIIANAPSGVSDLVFLAKRMSDIFSDSFGRILESMIARYEYGKSIFLFFCVSFVLSPFLMSLDLFLRLSEVSVSWSAQGVLVFYIFMASSFVNILMLYLLHGLKWAILLISIFTTSLMYVVFHLFGTFLEGELLIALVYGVGLVTSSAYLFMQAVFNKEVEIFS